jgi:hypothetical protein
VVVLVVKTLRAALVTPVALVAVVVMLTRLLERVHLVKDLPVGQGLPRLLLLVGAGAVLAA